MRAFVLSLLFAALVISSSRCAHSPARLPGEPNLHLPGEVRLDRVRQLTHEGYHSEVHAAFNGDHWVVKRGLDCGQIFTVRTDGSDALQISGRKGRALSCAFLPKDDRILLSSTESVEETCSPSTEKGLGELRAVPAGTHLYTVRSDASDPLPFEPAAPTAYNSEANVCRDGSVIFTSDREGDLELYRGKLDRLGALTEVTRVTRALGYDGGATFSEDCQWITWHAARPRGELEEADYKAQLKKHFLRNSSTEIWIARADGSEARQLTLLGVASITPVFERGGHHILFASNTRNPQTNRLDLYRLATDGTQLERIIFSDSSDYGPAFSADGKTLAFITGRASPLHVPQVFAADWITPSTETAPTLADPLPQNRLRALVNSIKAAEQAAQSAVGPGFVAAENILVEQLTTAKLAPFFKSGSYLQKVEMVLSASRRLVAAHNVAGTWGKACGKLPPVIIATRLNALETNEEALTGPAIWSETIRAAARGIDEKRSCLIFVAWVGEENEPAGLDRFAALLKELKIRPKAVIEIDHGATLQDNHLAVLGTDSAKEWAPWVASACAREHLLCDSAGNDLPSDAGPWDSLKVPTLRVTTRVHVGGAKTTPTTVDTLNFTGAAQVTRALTAFVAQVASPQSTLRFLKSTRSGPASQTPMTVKSTKIPTGYLGTIPDYSVVPEGGVRLSGARPGSPAANAGIQSGDVLMSIDLPAAATSSQGPRRVKNLEAYMAILRSLKPGDEITLHVRRGAQELAIPARVGQRGN